MVTKKPINWFLTGRGRNFSFALVTGTSLALTTVRFAPHTFLLEKYKDFVHFYSNGQRVKLPMELQERCQHCIDILKLSDTHRKLISPFSVYGFDLFHAGSCKFKFGAAIGIPVNFTYKSLADVENDNVQVNQKKVDLSSEVGNKLANALILPEKVQEFAISREILMTLNHKVMFESSYPFICIFFAFSLSQKINNRMNLYAAPVIFRATLYSILGLFSLGLYFLLQDMTEVYYETEADKKLCELGQEYVESGVIFYEKLLQRNQALRELMGKEGEKKYSKKGNENFGIRQPRLALVHRKQFFENQLKERQSQENSGLLTMS